MTHYQESSREYLGCECQCKEEIALLQKKLTEVHSKLIAQIQVSAHLESELAYLHRLTSHSYDTFGSAGKENLGRSLNKGKWREEESEGIQIKNDLLQADLEAMRRRVLSEITEKNKLLEEIGDLKKTHRKQLAQQVKKFQGLEILYRQAAGQKGLQYVLPSLETAADLERLRIDKQKAQALLQTEIEKKRRIVVQNEQLQAYIQDLRAENSWLKKQVASLREERAGEQSHSPDQLREMESLKQQITSINRNITLHQMQFERGRQKRREDQRSSPDCRGLQTRLVEPRWGNRIS